MMHMTARADARANRARLIEAAHAVFRERGLDAEMKEIAERAGVGIGTIYRNFPSKDDLIAAIFGEMVAGMLATTDRAMTIDDPVQAVREFLRASFAVVERYGDLMMILMRGALPPACEVHFEGIDRLEMVSGLVRKGIDAGVFRADLDPELASAGLVGPVVPWMYQQLRRTHTPDEILDAHVQLFLRGALAAGTATGPSAG